MAEKTLVPVERASVSQAVTTTAKIASFKITIDHPRLRHTDAKSICTFMRNYEQCQISSNSPNTENVRPVNLKFCVDVDYLQSTIALGFLEGADCYKTLTDSQVQAFVAKRAEESKEAVTLDKLYKIVKDELRTNMRNSDATARMQDLFANYHTILRRHGLGWIIKENQNFAVTHDLSTVAPQSLKERL